MALKTAEVALGDYTVRITQMPGMRNLKMFARLAKFLGPSLMTMLEELAAEAEGLPDQKDKKGLMAFVGDLDVGNLAGTVGQFCEKLDPDVIERFALDFAADCKVIIQTAEEKKVADLTTMFDIVFAGGLDLMFKWIAAVLTLNYPAFLGGSGDE